MSTPENRGRLIAASTRVMGASGLFGEGLIAALSNGEVVSRCPLLGSKGDVYVKELKMLITSKGLW